LDSVLHVWDAHCHYHSRKQIEQRAQRRGVTLEELMKEWNAYRKLNRPNDPEYEIPPNDPVDMAKKWLDEMDKYSQNDISIDKVTLFARDLDSLKIATDFSDRLIGFIFLDLAEDKDPVELLEVAVSQYGVQGIKMIPSNMGIHLYSKPYWPIYEFAERHQLPITLHMGLLIGGGNLHYLNPLDVQPVAREFPGVNFILAHLGGGYVREVLFLFYQTDNVYVDTSSSNIWYKYLPYPDISLKNVFKKYLEVGAIERIIFGTDSGSFPRGFRNNLLQDQLDILRALGASPEDIQKIMRDTFAKLLPG